MKLLFYDVIILQFMKTTRSHFDYTFLWRTIL